MLTHTLSHSLIYSPIINLSTVFTPTLSHISIPNFVHIPFPSPSFNLTRIYCSGPIHIHTNVPTPYFYPTHITSSTPTISSAHYY